MIRRHGDKKTVTCRTARLWMLVCMLLVIGSLTACKDEKVSQTTETTGVINLEIAPETEAMEQKPVIIETAVCQLYFPAEVSDKMIHVEAAQDGEALEVFYVLNGESRLEVFRVLFSAAESVNDIGIMKMEDGDKYISVAVSSYPDADFADDEAKENYYSVISALNTVVESIRADGRFCEKSEAENRQSSAELSYWEFTLPENMEWEEIPGEDYVAAFYGNVNGEKIMLYSVCVGDTQLGSKLGYYQVDGQWKTVSMEGCDLPDTEGWTDNQVTELYTMMSSINDVIQVIMSSENYSEEIPA